MKKIILIILLLIPVFTYAKEKVIFSSCVDGDTIKVKIDGDIKTVRFLAVDTPETVHPTKGVEYYGKEASVYTCNAVENAKKLELEYDDNSDKLDKYGRVLAWVFVDDTLLQNSLVKEGYAKIEYIYGDYKYLDLLEESEKIAKSNKLGIWSDFEEETVSIWIIIAVIILSIIYAYFRKDFKKLLKKSKIKLKLK